MYNYASTSNANVGSTLRYPSGDLPGNSRLAPAGQDQSFTAKGPMTEQA